MPREAIVKLSKCLKEMKRVRTLVLETRLEFLEKTVINKIRFSNPRLSINILTGFETVNEQVRNNILGKRETLQTFREGLDRVSECEAALTAFVLFKPSPFMDDTGAYIEANDSIDFLVRECEKRDIDLTIRLNPMYSSKNTAWARMALKTTSYKPPRLTDVINLAEKKSSEGVRLYIGLSAEDFDIKKGSYRFREDFSEDLLKDAILFNNGKMR